MGLNAYLEEIVSTAHYPVTFAADEPRSLCRWLVRAARKPASAAGGTEPWLETDGRTLLMFETAVMPAEEQELGWRYCRSDIAESFYEPVKPGGMFAPERDKLIYSVCGVYAVRETEAVLDVIAYFPAPLRVWLNGVPLVAGTDSFVVKDTFVRIRFREGLNILLVEMQSMPAIPLSAQEFLIKLQPLDRLLDAAGNRSPEYEYFDLELLEDLRASLSLYPEKADVLPGDELRVVVLPQYVRRGGDQPVEIRLEDAEAEDGAPPLAVIRSATSSVAALSVPAGLPPGVLRLRAEGLRDGAAAKPVYLFCGSFAEERKAMLKQAETRADIGRDVVVSAREMTSLGEAFAALNQYVQPSVRNTVLKLTAKLRRALAEAEKGGERAHARSFADIYDDEYIVYRPKPTNDGYLSYGVLLPERYDPLRRYPLVFYFHDSIARSFPTDLPWVRRYRTDEAIIVQLTGIARLNYVNDIQVSRLIGEIANELNADPDRIYGIGFCTGAPKTYRMAMLAPDRFAAIAAIAGDARLRVNGPEYEWLDNLHNTEVYGLCLYESWFFNAARNLNFLRRMNRKRIALYGGFMHNEFNSWHNSRTLLHRLIGTVRERFPKEVRLQSVEPGFVKNAWVRIGRIARLGEPARVYVSIAAGRSLEAACDNVDRFELLLARKEMGLDAEVVLSVNGFSHRISPAAYSRVAVELSGGVPAASMETLTPDEFEAAYSASGIEESQMGIRKVYLAPCTVVKPADGGPFAAKLAYLLQNPMKDRYIPYRYESCREETFEPETAEVSRIWVIDARRQSGKQRKLLYGLGLSANASGIAWRGKKYEGDAFAAVLGTDPWRPDRLALALVYNSEACEGEMLRLLNAFETDPLFAHDAIFYCTGGGYDTIRGGEHGAISLGGRMS
ncbi:hypothetical protein ACFPPD_05010 [Cohnella suwonensis]|uniref:Uncharacterized protein n=1 Tax=Cohnella suwonensis TaxID=696072 RepID=A0ABW0LS25_9BACL